ncbi:MAG TPA: DEAD/DEAH box helicase family protein [Phycisphaerales bacterium]|nr:DEAD/DEAH box helicase family protein [Phycisphaerales bacterium]HMP38017.1 DEAD/DEAH box helicase family protein [Phycisphaerales bacterium]
MKLQFDPNQPFQLDAIASVVDLFDGQPVGDPEFTPISLGAWGEGLLEGRERTELGIGNRLLLDGEKLLANTRAVQERNDIDLDAEDEADGEGAIPQLDAWDIFDSPANAARACPHFSVEMETGTGKTYVYLRTIFELSERYGFQKFIIVVPSVAIREGVLKSLEIMAEHFRALYNNRPFEHFVYDAKKVSRLRHFATSSTLQLLVMNIDAFRKNFTGTESEQKSNVIYKESDKLSGRQPIEFVQAARPIVIIDEPQSVDSTEKAQEAIKALNPLCTLRYSATHRNPYNLVYRLDPVRAFELRLVKQIVVATASAEGAMDGAFVRVEQIDYKKGIKAKLRINRQGAEGPKPASVTVKQGDDLFTKSNERAEYQNGYEVAEITAEPGSEFIRFANGRTLRLGEEVGGVREDVWRAQIKHTIKRHLEKELQVRGRGIKVLSLFFIDRVANYREYGEDGRPMPGKFAVAFEEELASLASDVRYAEIDWLRRVREGSIGKLHDGYFSEDRKGVLKDTRGDTQADDETYAKIMRNKEQLLSIEEPLRFIFSHSALREGWDNPNVFQICTLNETASAVKKRQEIGRGLRLPVDQSGARVFDDSVNKLYVMANESYEDFAKALQTEYENDCGVTFGKVPLSALARLTWVPNEVEEPVGREGAKVIREALVDQGMLDRDGRIQPAFDPQAVAFRLELPSGYRALTSAVVDVLASYQIERHVHREQDRRQNPLKKAVVLSPEFQALWDRIKARTTYRVEFQTDELVRRAVTAIKLMPKVERSKIAITTGGVRVRRGGVDTTLVGAAVEEVAVGSRPVPDVLAYLQNETELTRSTIATILREAGRLDEFFESPQRYMDAVAAILKDVLRRLLVDGVKYDRRPHGDRDASWEMVLFEDEELVDYLTSLKVGKSVYEYVSYDSEVEREFARQLDEREDIRLFVKLPRGFKVDTPLGQYNPDWAIVKHDGQAIYLVRETKGTKDFLKLRSIEADKVRCGMKHFATLGVDFKVAVTADEV